MKKDRNMPYGYMNQGYMMPNMSGPMMEPIANMNPMMNQMPNMSPGIQNPNMGSPMMGYDNNQNEFCQLQGQINMLDKRVTRLENAMNKDDNCSNNYHVM